MFLECNFYLELKIFHIKYIIIYKYIFWIIIVLILEIVLPIPTINNFYYLCSRNKKPIIGARVIVPFNNKKMLGIIVKIYRNKDLGCMTLKKVTSIIDNESIYTENLWKLILWCVDYYHCSMREIIYGSLPYLLKKGKLLKKNFILNGVLQIKEKI